MIRQFDVVQNPVTSVRRAWPYLVCVQHNNLLHLPVRLVAPLASEQFIKEPSRLYPGVRIDQRTLFFIPHDLASRPVQQLGAVVGNIEDYRDTIIAALDLVFTGV